MTSKNDLGCLLELSAEGTEQLLNRLDRRCDRGTSARFKRLIGRSSSR